MAMNLNCVFCLAEDDKEVEAEYIVDMTSLCGDHVKEHVQINDVEQTDMPDDIEEVPDDVKDAMDDDEDE